ncbi:hypothetical protein IKT64_01190 [Candidatus Saccharibacteria bacterium]|nr:hypothetical protein [Candidatus Saccharibacteria bacterium]
MSMSPERKRLVFGVALVIMLAMLTSVLAVACHGCNHKKTETTPPTTSDSVVPTNTSEPTTSETEKPTDTPTPSPTPVPTDTPTPVPTDTPTPEPTPTPVPTDTPTPEPTPTKAPKPTKAPTEPTSKPTDPPPPETTPEPPVTTPEPPPETTPAPSRDYDAEYDAGYNRMVELGYIPMTGVRSEHKFEFCNTNFTYKGKVWLSDSGKWVVKYSATDANDPGSTYNYSKSGTDLVALINGIDHSWRDY